MNIISKKYQPKRYVPNTETKSIDEIKSLMLGKRYANFTKKGSFEMSPKAKYFKPEISSNNLKVNEFSYRGNKNIYSINTKKLSDNTSRLSDLILFEYKPVSLNTDTSDFITPNNNTLVSVDYFSNNSIDYVPKKIDDFTNDTNITIAENTSFNGNINQPINTITDLTINKNESVTEIYTWDYTNMFVDNRPNVLKFVNDNNLQLPTSILEFKETPNDTNSMISAFNYQSNIIDRNIVDVNIPINTTIIDLVNYENDNNVTIVTPISPSFEINISTVNILDITNIQNNSIVEITEFDTEKNNDSIVDIKYHTPILNNILNAPKFVEIGMNLAKDKLREQLMRTDSNVVINNIPTIKEYVKTENKTTISDNKNAKLFDILEWYNNNIQKKGFDNNHNSSAIQFSNINDIVGTSNFTEYVANVDAKNYYGSVNNFKSTLSNRYSLPSGYINVRDVNQRNDTTIDKITNLDVGEDYGNLEDLIPFRFQNYEKTDNLIFRATLSGLSDSFNGNWDEVEYIGRSDKSYQYNSFERSIGFGFVVMIGSKHEFKTVWKKLNHLAKYTTPKYINNRKTGNLMRLTIGDLWQNMVGFVTSVSYTFSDDVAWEINQFNDSDLKKLPRHIEVGIEYTPISTYRPEFDSNLYDFIDNW